MKKNFLLLFMFVLVMVIGCGDDSDSKSQGTENVEKVESSSTSAEVKYSVCDVIEIIGCTKVYSSSSLADYTSYAFVNNSEKNVKDIVLYIAYFDSNKMLLGDSYIEANCNSVNATPGSMLIELYKDSAGNYTYLNYIIGKVKYEDGTVWELDNPDEWLKEIIQDKDKMISNYNELLAQYKARALKCDDYSASKTTLEMNVIKGSNMVAIGGQYDLSIKLVNNGTKNIEAFRVRMAFYKDGKIIETPLDSFMESALRKDDSYNNGRYGNGLRLTIWPDAVIKPGQTYNGVENYLFEDGNVEMKYIVELIQYDDKTIWRNPNCGLWSGYYSNNAE